MRTLSLCIAPTLTVAPWRYVKGVDTSKTIGSRPSIWNGFGLFGPSKAAQRAQQAAVEAEAEFYRQYPTLESWEEQKAAEKAELAAKEKARLQFEDQDPEFQASKNAAAKAQKNKMKQREEEAFRKSEMSKAVSRAVSDCITARMEARKIFPPQAPTRVSKLSMFSTARRKPVVDDFWRKNWLDCQVDAEVQSVAAANVATIMAARAASARAALEDFKSRGEACPLSDRDGQSVDLFACNQGENRFRAAREKLGPNAGDLRETDSSEFQDYLALAKKLVDNKCPDLDDYVYEVAAAWVACHPKTGKAPANCAFSAKDRKIEFEDCSQSGEGCTFTTEFFMSTYYTGADEWISKIYPNSSKRGC